MDEPYQASKDIYVLPASFPVPGAGVLTINAFLLRAEEPVLVDSGVGADADSLVDAISGLIDPSSIRWVWLTHDDSDHTGAVQRVMEIAPRATLVTHALGALRMATWWPVPLDRVHAIRPGDVIHAGDRTLTAVAPPLFDNPMSTGFIDGSTGALFSVDSFGGILPEPAQDASEVPAAVLAGGMVAWAAFDSPWTRLVDRDLYREILQGVRRLEPTAILSSHLPPAPGSSMEQFLQILDSVPDADPFVAPDQATFQQMLSVLTAAGPPA